MSTGFRVRTAIVGTNGGPQLSTHYFQTGGTNTAQSAADAVHAFWDQIKTMCISGYTFTVEPTVETIDLATGQPVGSDPVTTTTVTGTAGGGMMSPTSQLLIRWRTGHYLGGREVRGRTFVPGLALSALGSNGNVSSAAITAMNAAATAIISWTSSDFAVYSKVNHDLPIVTTGDPWGSFAVLRSRRD